MYSYDNLKNISDKELTDCFNQAFADYPLPFHLTEEELKARLRASCVDKELSYGAFFNGKLIGFILNSLLKKWKPLFICYLLRWVIHPSRRCCLPIM